MQIEYRTLSHPVGSIDIRIKGGFSTQYQKWKTCPMEEGWDIYEDNHGITKLPIGSVIYPRKSAK